MPSAVGFTGVPGVRTKISAEISAEISAGIFAEIFAEISAYPPQVIYPSQGMYGLCNGFSYDTTAPRRKCSLYGPPRFYEIAHGYR